MLKRDHPFVRLTVSRICTQPSDRVHGGTSCWVSCPPPCRTAERLEPDSWDCSSDKNPLTVVFHGPCRRLEERPDIRSVDFLLSALPSDVRAVTHFTRMPYLRLLSFLAFQRPQRPDSIHQATAICMMGNHIHGLDSHELPAIAPSPGGKKTREARTSAV
jgi:hypothetical protein